MKTSISFTSSEFEDEQYIVTEESIEELKNSLKKSKESERPMSIKTSQKMAQNDPENKIPSTHAKAMSLCENGLFFDIHNCAHSAFLETLGMVWIPLNKCSLLLSFLTYLSIIQDYNS